MLGFTPDGAHQRAASTPAVPDALREQLLPVLREALSNVARHAPATRAEVEVVVDAARAARSPSLDDGVGLVEDRARERAAQRAATGRGCSAATSSSTRRAARAGAPLARPARAWRGWPAP